MFQASSDHPALKKARDVTMLGSRWALAAFLQNNFLREGSMKKFLGAAIAMALLAGSAPAIAGKKVTASVFCGTTYSVAAEEGSLLLHHRGKFSLIHIGYSATIHNGKGQPLALEDIRPGDWIEYWTDPVARTLVRKISVNSGARGICPSTTVLGRR
jgi:hypothetical protein